MLPDTFLQKGDPTRQIKVKRIVCLGQCAAVRRGVGIRGGDQKERSAGKGGGVVLGWVGNQGQE